MNVKKGKEVGRILRTQEERRGMAKDSVLLRLLAEYHLRAKSDILIDLLVGVVAFLFARTHALFGVYPFAIAWIASLKRHVFPAFLGALIGCCFLGESGVLYVAVFGVLFLLRILFSYIVRKRMGGDCIFSEPPAARVLAAATVGCFMAAYELILFGVYDYTVLFALGTVLLPSALTFAFSFLADADLSLRALLGKAPYRIGLGHGARWVEATGALFLFCLVFSLKPFSFFGVSVASCVSACFILLAAKRFGALRASALGLVVALATAEVAYVPAFGLFGLLAGVYQAVGMPCALAAAVLAAGGYAFYAGELTGFLAVVPELSVSALFTWPFLKSLARAEDGFFLYGTEACASSAPAAEEKENSADATVADAYDRIAETLSVALHQENTIGEEEYVSLCKKVKEGVCFRCAYAEGCKQEEIVLRALTDMTYSAEQAEGCEAFSRMTEKLRAEAAVLLQKKKLGGAHGAFCTEYELHAQLLRECDQKKKEDEREDSAASETLATLLLENGISVERVCVTGKRKRCVRLEDVRWRGGQADERILRALCAKVCGESLDGGQIHYNGKRIGYSFQSEERFTVSFATATAPALFGEPSGDRACSFSSPYGMAYAVLCDGMGSGRAAGHASDICLSVLSSLLSFGAQTKTALALLGNLLCAAEHECSVAIDLLSVDLLQGKASFLKSGAAASFVKRGDALYRIRAKTIPMGVFREVDCEEVHLDLAEGDLLILFSDGVMSGSEDGGWLKELLRETLCDNLSDLARAVLAVASEREGASHDDRTVLLARVGKKETAHAEDMPRAA